MRYTRPVRWNDERTQSSGLSLQISTLDDDDDDDEEESMSTMTDNIKNKLKNTAQSIGQHLRDKVGKLLRWTKSTDGALILLVFLDEGERVR